MCLLINAKQAVCARLKAIRCGMAQSIVKRSTAQLYVPSRKASSSSRRGAIFGISDTEKSMARIAARSNRRSRDGSRSLTVFCRSAANSLKSSISATCLLARLGRIPSGDSDLLLLDMLAGERGLNAGLAVEDEVTLWRMRRWARV